MMTMPGVARTAGQTEVRRPLWMAVLAIFVAITTMFSFASQANAQTPPTFSKEFSPSTINPGDVSTLTFTIDNTASTVAVTNFAFIDDLPAGMEFTSPGNIGTDCIGGSLITDSRGRISFNGATLAAGSSCTVRVDVTSSTPGALVNTSQDLTSSLGNSGTASATLTVNGPPTPVITGVPAETDGVTPFTATITFDEAVTGFGDPGDVTAANAAVGAITAISASVYTVQITPNGSGDVTVGVPAGVAVDTNGLANEAATPVVAKLDAIPPTVEILGAPASIAATDSFNVTIQFSETVVGFAAGDITIGNGSVTGFTAVDGDTYSVTITPGGGGDITIDVAAGVANDVSGNPNEAAKQVVVKSTVVEDTVKIIGAFMGARSRIITQNQPDSKRRLDRLNGTTSNNGSISGFGMSLTSGKIPFAAKIGEDSASFSYSLRASRAKAGEDRMTADVESILGQNGIQRSPTIDSDESVADRMQREAEERFNARFASLPANDNESRPGSQPGTQEGQSRLPATKEVAANDNRTIALQEYSYAATRVDTAHAGEQYPRPPGPADFVSVEDRFDIWAEGTYGRYDGFGGTGSFAVVHLGMDYLVTSGLLVGLGGQLDWLTYDNAVEGNADGFGFMIGPYATVRLTERFYGDARIAWGTSSNSASPYDTYSDDFDTQRWIATAAIFGDFDYGGVLVRPEVRMTWFTEESDSYLDSLGNTIPSVKVESGTLEFGPTLSKAMLLDNGVTFTPSFTAKGIWTFASQNSADAITTLPEGLTEEGIRALVEGSLDFASANGYRFGLTGSYDGIGDDKYEAWSLKGRLAVSW